MIPPALVATNPFPGLRPFKTEENYLFFGREGQADELLLRLRTRRFVAVVGTSGSGKSSLVRAGLLPALYSGFMTEAGSRWRVAVFRPINDPVGNLARALCEPDVFGAGGGDEDDDDPGSRLTSVETTLRRSSYGLIEAVRQGRLAEGENLLVVADQFEELFRFRAAADGPRAADGRRSGDEAESFVRLLLEAARQTELPVYVILTMRSDYLGECAQFWGLPEAINEGQYLIPRMDDDERREAINGPVAVEGGEITSPLVNRLVNDLGDNPDQLPILQHALMRTWDEWKERRREVEVRDGASGETVRKPHLEVHEGEEIDQCCYEAVGGMSRALSLHADEAFGELSPRLQEVAKRIFQALTEKESQNREVRRPTELGLLCEIAEATEDEVKEVVEVFRREGRSFLMPPPPAALDADTQIDISHESLIRNWDELRKWASEEAVAAGTYLRLSQTASLFEKGEEFFLSGPALQAALEWRKNSRPNAAWARRYDKEHGSDYETAVKFLDDSRLNREQEEAEKKLAAEQKLHDAEALAEARRRSVRQLKWGVAILSAFLLAMAGLAYYAFRQQSEAVRQRIEAVRQGAEAARQTVRAEDALREVAVERDTARAAEREAEKQRALAEEKRIEADEQRIAARNAERKAKDALAQVSAAAVRARRAEGEAVKARDDALKSAKAAVAEAERAKAAEARAVEAETKAQAEALKAETAAKTLNLALAELERAGIAVPTPTPEATPEPMPTPTPETNPTPTPTPSTLERPVTKEVLRQLVPTLTDKQLEEYLPNIRAAMVEFDINTPLRQAAFLAQAAHETGGFRFFVEPWDKYPTAYQKRYDPPGVLAKVLGNTEQGDGFRFRGRGAFMLSGRKNYRYAGRDLGLDLVSNPDLAAEPELVFRTAALYWRQRGLNSLADKGDMRQITKIINGAYLGWDSRCRYYERARSLLGVPGKCPK